MALRNRIGRIEEFADVAIRKELLDGSPESATALRLELRLDAATPLRLDRLLAGELGVSRSRLQGWEEQKRLVIEPGNTKALRKPARNSTAVRIDLTGEADRDAILSAASG
ncbi:DUF1062 domain-containing protein [Mesorhizobium sp.]|uniref:DUF1062 domain-containing protein n=1 Tax=Mesorhizobium sp. TaxID=1871066 RepID=UPI0034537BDC